MLPDTLNNIEFDSKTSEISVNKIKETQASFFICKKKHNWLVDRLVDSLI